MGYPRSQTCKLRLVRFTSIGQPGGFVKALSISSDVPDGDLRPFGMELDVEIIRCFDALTVLYRHVLGANSDDFLDADPRRVFVEKH